MVGGGDECVVIRPSSSSPPSAVSYVLRFLGSEAKGVAAEAAVATIDSSTSALTTSYSFASASSKARTSKAPDSDSAIPSPDGVGADTKKINDKDNDVMICHPLLISYPRTP